MADKRARSRGHLGHSSHGSDEKTHHFDLIYSIKPSFFKFLNRMSITIRHSIKFLIAIAGFLLVAFLPLGIDYHAHMALAIFVGIALMWTTEAIPMPVTALLVPVLLTAFGIFETDEALIPFANPIVYLLLGGVILAGAVHKTGLDKRMLYPFLIRSKGKVDKFLLSLMLVAFILSMWISNTATVALMAPFALTISNKVPDKAVGRKLATLFLLGIGFAAVIGGVGTVIGSAPNAVTSAILADNGPWTFLDWMIVGIPTACILLFISWKILLITLKPPKVELEMSDIEQEYKARGPMSSHEKITILVFVFTIIFWILGAKIGSYFGFPSSFMSAAIVGLLAVVALFVTGIMRWADARIIPWGVFLILGAGLALGEAIVNTGAADWITQNLTTVFFGLPAVLIIFIFCLVIVLVSNFLNNTASAAIFIPILISLASTLGENVRVFVLPVALILSMAFITPIGTPPITLIYTTGRVPRRTLAKIGLLIIIPAIFVCLGIVLLFHYVGLL